MIEDKNKVRLKNLMYGKREYALEALLNTIVKNGEFPEDEVIGMFLTMDIFDGSVSEKLLKRSFEVLSRYWSPRNVGEYEVKVVPTSDKGKASAIKVVGLYEAIFKKPVEDFTDMECKYLYSNKGLSTLTSNTSYFSYINDRRMAAGKNPIQFTKNLEYSKLPLPSLIYSRYEESPESFGKTLRQMKSFANTNAFTMMAAGLAMIYSGVEPSEVCKIREDQVDRNLHAIAMEDGHVVHIPADLWDFIAVMLSRNSEFIPSEFVLKAKNSLSNRTKTKDDQLTYNNFGSNLKTTRGNIEAAVNSQRIRDDDPLYAKYIATDSVSESGLFYRAYSEGIRTEDDFKIYSMQNSNPTKRGVQKVNMRANIYIQWLEMFHK